MGRKEREENGREEREGAGRERTPGDWGGREGDQGREKVRETERARRRWSRKKGS